jgi:methylase of polypeptide subunit release factors
LAAATEPPPTRLRFVATSYLGLTATRRIRAEIEIEIAERAYPPDLSDLKRDWVASVAAPAFSALARRRPAEARRSFCTIGTGSGVDALAAIEILQAGRIAITDLFEDVVAAAAANIRNNLAEGINIDLAAASGDLLSALPEEASAFDVIYENLPNLPTADAGAVAVGRASAAHLAARVEAVSESVRQNHLTLHALALAAARPRLAPGGVMLSTIGSRVPLAEIVEMSESAGFVAHPLTFGWKLQADADTLIATHAAHQADGFGPFRFYAADRLEALFAGLGAEAAGARAFELEAALAAHALDAPRAWEAHQRGAAIGHTFVVLASSPQRAP